MKDTGHKKSASALLAFFQQILVYAGDLLQQRLTLSKAAEPFLDLLLQVGGNGDLPYPPVSWTDRENRNRAVAFALAFFAKAATGLVAADHTAHE